MTEDGLALIHGDATKDQVQVTPASFTGKTSDTTDYDGQALPNALSTIVDSDGLNEVIKAIDIELGVIAGNITTGDTDQVSKSLFDANTILKADSDDTPLALTVSEDTLVGRKIGGDIAALSPTDVLSVLGITATIAELNFVSGVTSAIQTQIDGNDTDITNLQAKFPVITADIQNVAVTNAKLANNAVSNAKLDSTLQTDITQITTNKTDITTLTNLTAINEQTIFGRRTGDSTAIGLTATQTLTLLGITVSATDINRLVGITDDVQVQIDNISDTFGNIDAFDEVTISGMTAPTSVDLTHIIAAGIAFINNKRVSTSDTSHTYTANQDIYVDIDDGGTFTFIEVGNGDDAPALTTDSIRIMKVVTDVDNITGVTDLRPLDLRIDKLLGRKMDVPTGVTATLQSGGSLADGTELFYVVTATDGTGETIQSIEVSETPTGGNLTIKIDWSAVTKAKFYRIYKRESGIYKTFKEVTAPTVTLTDDGGVSFVTGFPPLFTNAYRAKLEDIGDVTLEIGSTPITSGTNSRILFEGTGNFLQESANFTWDDSTSTLAVTGDVDISKHMALGANASIRSDTILNIRENSSSGDDFFAIFFNAVITSTNVVATLTGADCQISMGGAIGANEILGVNIFVQSDITAGTAPNLKGLSLKLGSSGISPATTRVIEILSPTFSGGAQPSVYDGINIANQGVSGITTSAALNIANQTGSTNNYAIITGAGKIGFNQPTPVSSVHITGEGTDSGTTSLIVEDSIGTDILVVRNDGFVIVSGNATISKHMGVGSTGFLSNEIILRVKETITTNQTINGINCSVTLDSTDNTKKVIGVVSFAQMNGTTGGTDIIGAEINATSNVTAGTSPNLIGQTIKVVNDSGALAPSTAKVLDILSPTFDGGIPTTYDGINIANQGVSGITTSTALNIQSQSGSTNNNAIITGAGRIGFNQPTPLARVHITGEGTDLTTTALIVENSAGTDILVVRDDGLVVIGTTLPFAQLHVDQSSSTAALPVLLLDQADISEEMIEFRTTIGVGNAIEAVGAKTLTTTHFIKVTLPGPLTRYIPVGTIA